MSTGSPAGLRPRLSLKALLATVIATGLGSGYAPFAPGTAGSLVGLVLFLPMTRLTPTVQVLLTTVMFFVGVAASTHTAERVGRKDPGLVVVDEVVGMWVSLLFLPITPFTLAVSFFFFRVMDVLKPYPARQFEALPRGWGIMTDDLMAGIYANLLLRVVLLVWPAA